MVGPRPRRPTPPRPPAPPTPPAPPKFSWAPYIAMGVILFFILALAPRIGFMPMILVFFVGLFIVRRVMASARRYWDDHGRDWRSVERDAFGVDHAYWEKRKNRPYRAPSAQSADEDQEKPKRHAEYTVGDDGELVELDAALTEEPPKRAQGGSDTFV